MDKFNCTGCHKDVTAEDLNKYLYQFCGDVCCKACSINIPRLKLLPQDVEDIKRLAETCDSLPMLIKALEMHSKVVDAQMSELYGEY